MVKIYLVLILAALASQLSAGPALDSAGPQDIVDDVTELISELGEVVQKAAAIAIDDIDNALDAFQDVVNGLFNQSLSQIQDGVDKLKAQLDELKIRAHDAGADITDCLTNEYQITKLPAEITAGVTECLNNAQLQAASAVKAAENAIQDVVDIIDQRETEFKVCQTNFFTFPICAAGVVVKVTADIIQQPIKIATDATEFVQNITKLASNAKLCVAEQVASIPVKGGVVLAQIATCVEDKISNKSTSTSSTGAPTTTTGGTSTTGAPSDSTDDSTDSDSTDGSTDSDSPDGSTDSDSNDGSTDSGSSTPQ